MAKWALHRHYSKHNRIRSYLPPTSIFTKKTMTSYLKRYKSIYLKPNTEHTGKGIIKAWKAGQNYCYILIRGKTHTYSSIKKLFDKINKQRGHKRYIIQPDLMLAQVDGNPFDIRVMMMRNAKQQWKYVGMCSKVAGPSSIITNSRRSGGYVTSVGDSLAASLGYSEAKIQSLIQKLIRLSYMICSHANKFRYTSEIGIDFGIDTKGRIWLIEVNFDYPSHALFNKMSDKSYYIKIKSMAEEYKKRKKDQK